MAMDRSSRPMHRGRKKVCSFCVDRIDRIDYKDLPRTAIPRRSGCKACGGGFLCWCAARGGANKIGGPLWPECFLPE